METGFCTRLLGTEQQAEDESSEQCVGGSGSVSAAGQRQSQGARQRASALMRGGRGGPVAAEPRGRGAVALSGKSFWNCPVSANAAPPLLMCPTCMKFCLQPQVSYLVSKLCYESIGAVEGADP